MPTDRPIGDSASPLVQLDVVERHIQSLTQKLEHRERLATLGTIAALIAHEFNNVLTPVRAYAQMALARPDDRELTAKALRRAQDGAERATEIAGVILGFVKVPAGAGGWDGGPDRDRPAPPCQASVNQAIDQALACLVRDLSKDRILLRRECPSDLQAAIRPVALQHVLLNLFLNARAAMLPGGGELRITVVRSRDGPLRFRPDPNCSTWNNSSPATENHPNIGRNYVKIEISDTGIGIPPEQLMSLPQMTKQQPNIKCIDESNTGLGLKFCYKMLTEIGGSLAIQSVEGKQTICTVLLPEFMPVEQRLRRSA